MTRLVQLSRRASDQRYARVSAAARAFATVALAVPLLWSRDESALLGLLALTGIWTASQVAVGRVEVSVTLVSTLEAAAIGTVCGLTLSTAPSLLGALAIPPLTAGLWRGARPMALSLSAELTALVTVTVVLFTRLHSDQGVGIFTVFMTGLGLGLIGSYLHAALQQAPDPLAPYRYAQALIRQLIDLSGGLSSGLDPVALGGAILSSVRDELPAAALVLHVPRGHVLSPLLTKTVDVAEDFGDCDEVAAESWALGRPVVAGRVFAFPLITDADTIAVVAGRLSQRVDAGRVGLDAALSRLVDRLQASAVHLDTALLFSAFRDAATASERRRLAREMHDGVAQDIASLGYLVDVLAAHPASPVQAEQLNALRGRITAVVAEVRRSVVNLRTAVGASESLGVAIGGVARHLTEQSGAPITVTLDEQATRLRPDVEAELFRIAQEALTNAVRHSHARTIEVHCEVHAPAALITVTDDGRGLQPGRGDSYGIKIMHERALLVGAHLEITDRPGGGAVVTVRLPGVDSSDRRPSDAQVTA